MTRTEKQVALAGSILAGGAILAYIFWPKGSSSSETDAERELDFQVGETNVTLHAGEQMYVGIPTPDPGYAAHYDVVSHHKAVADGIVTPQNYKVRAGSPGQAAVDLIMVEGGTEFTMRLNVTVV